MSTTTRLMTADELLLVPKFDGTNDHRHELIAGELITMSPTGYTHGVFSARLAAVFIDYVEAHDLGVVCGAETGFVVETNPDTVIAPDVAFIGHQKVAAVEDPQKYVRVAPDLAVEVLSPTDSLRRVERKIKLFLAVGTQAVVVVNSKKRTVTVHRANVAPQILTEHDALELPDVLPGFCYELTKLFRTGKR